MRKRQRESRHGATKRRAVEALPDGRVGCTQAVVLLREHAGQRGAAWRDARPSGAPAAASVLRRLRPRGPAAGAAPACAAQAPARRRASELARLHARSCEAHRERVRQRRLEAGNQALSRGQLKVRRPQLLILLGSSHSAHQRPQRPQRPARLRSSSVLTSLAHCAATRRAARAFRGLTPAAWEAARRL